MEISSSTILEDALLVVIAYNHKKKIRIKVHIELGLLRHDFKNNKEVRIF